jgi:hypothetical protein
MSANSLSLRLLSRVFLLDCGGERPATHLSGGAGIIQADAYAGYGALYRSGAKPHHSSGPRAGAKVMDYNLKLAGSAHIPC